MVIDRVSDVEFKRDRESVWCKGYGQGHVNGWSGSREGFVERDGHYCWNLKHYFSRYFSDVER